MFITPAWDMPRMHTPFLCNYVVQLTAQHHKTHITRNGYIILKNVYTK